MKRGSVLGLLLLALAASGAVAEDVTEEWPRWGVGWLSVSSAPTFRVRLGEWNLGVAARPSDNLNYRESWGQDSWGDAVPDSLRDVPDDDKTESGWVRLDVSRTLKRWQTVEFPLMAAFSYSWRDAEWSSRYWDENEQGFRSEVTNEYTNSYSLILAFRPSWRIRPWVSVDAEFGVRYNWSNFDRTRTTSRPEWESDRNVYETGHSKSFNSHGYSSGSSLGMLSLLFWF